MNHHEAKFILRAYRPDGADAGDPVFAPALDAAGRDPALKAWLDHEQATDHAIRDKLRESQPPPGLREAILAGSRASRRPRPWWQNPAWMAVAACIAIVFGLAVRLRPAGPTAQEFAAFALNELTAAEGDHDGGRPELRAIQTRIASLPTPLPGNPSLNGDELRRAGCRVLKFAGHDVLELCFKRNGRWYHLYAIRAGEVSRGVADPHALTLTKGGISATAWKDAHYAYALVTGAGPEALRKLM